MITSSRRLIAPGVLAGVIALVLTGCSDASEPSPESVSPRPSASASPTLSASPSASASSSASPSEAPAASGAASTPVRVDCETLVSLDAMYEFNPNYVSTPTSAVAAGSPAQVALDDEGTACTWVNTSSGDTIVISAAKPGDRAARVAAASGGTVTPELGGEAWFAVIDGLGTQQVFEGSAWVTVASPSFLEGADAASLARAALDAVG